MWNTYINTLLEYQKTMVNQTTLLDHTDPISAIGDDDKVILCSDGALTGSYSGGTCVITGENKEIYSTDLSKDTGHINFI